MKKLLLFFGFLMMLMIPAQSQDLTITQTIKGMVLDKQSQSPLPGVVVVLVGSNPLLGAVTDVNGWFHIAQVPLGRQSIHLEMTGYEPVTLGNILVNSAKQVEIRVEMQEAVSKMEQLVVKGSGDKRDALNALSTVSARTFSVEEAMRYSGSLQDPSKMAQNFAGVSGASDDRNDIIIRGNSPTGLLWRMEGVDIPSPNHFSTVGSTGGPVSMLNINNLSNSDFMTGAWSANYGNALSGVFDLNLRNGNAEKHEFLGQVGFNGFEFGAEGPLSTTGRASYMINYRYSTLAVMKSLKINTGTGAAIPEYQDLTFKLNFPMQKAGKLSLWGVGGKSYISFLADSTDTNNLYSGGPQNMDFYSQTGIVGLSHTLFLSPNTYQRLVLATSYTSNGGAIDSVSWNNNDITRKVGFYQGQSKISTNYKINHKWNAKHQLTAGVHADLWGVRLLDSLRQSDGNYLRYSDVNESNWLFQSYANWQFRPTDRWTVNLGTHSQHWLLSKAHSFEPRLGVKYKLSPSQNLSLGLGVHSQMQMMALYYLRAYDAQGRASTPNTHLGFSKSAQAVLGYDFFVTEQMRVKSEIYYQYLYQIPVQSTPTSFSMINEGAGFTTPYVTNLVNEGTASNQGWELTVEKFLSHGYYFLLTQSVFQSKYKGSDGIERNTAFNGNYVLNGLAGKEFRLSEKNTLSFDTKLTYAKGKRFTPINMAASQAAGTEIRDLSQAYSDQYSDYFRWDFKITFRQNARKFTQQWSVDLQNLTNHKNIFTQGYNPFTGKLGYTYQRGFFPDIQYKIYF